jgi:predicted dehydrogenase
MLKLMAQANSNIQVACIGFGIMGQGDCRTASSLPGVKITAVCDVYDGRLKKAKEVYGAGTFTTREYEEVLARKDVDAVIIATPDHWHARMAIDSMEAGKDVYCQKPMVQKVEEGLGVVDTWRRTKRIFQVGSQRVSSVLYAKAREVIRSGVLGKIHMVESYLDRNSALGAWQYSIPPDASPESIDWKRFLGQAPPRNFDPIRLFRWRNYQDYGTGVAGDLFVHLISGIHFVMDSMGPTRIVTMGGLHYWLDGRDVPDIMMGMYEYPETKTHAAFEMSLRCNFEAGGGDGQGFRFIGTDGVLSLNVGSGFTISRKPKDREPGNTFGTFDKENQEKGQAAYRQKYPPQRPTTAMMQGVSEERYTLPAGYAEQTAHHQNFFDAVRSRQQVVENAEFGFRAAAPALLSNTSFFEKKICLWDPEAMRVKG